MKKTLLVLFICFLSLAGYGQSIFKRGIAIGTTDSTAVVDSLVRYDSVFKMYSGTRRLIDYDVNSALPLGDYAWLKTDDEVVTETELESYEGGGAGYSKYKIQFAVGDLGFPEDGDSTVTHATFAGKEIELYRDGLSQRYNSTATNTVEGFRINNTTGEITVKPAFSTDEVIKIDGYDPVNVEWLTLVGTESTLLTNLMGFWKMDETSGTVFADALGVNNGTSTATLGQIGNFGYCQLFDGLGDYSRVPYSASLSVTGVSTLTISVWFKLTAISVADGQNLLCLKTNDANYWSILLRIDANNALIFYTKNSTGTTYDASTANGSFTTGVWYNAICVINGANPLAIYVDNVSSATSADTFSGTLLPYNDHIYFGTGSSTSVSWLRGYIEDVGIWPKAVSAGERAELQLETYPW